MSLTIGKKVSLSLFSLAFILAGGLFFVKDALAATGSMYISPSTSSIQQGNNLTVSLRINPGTTIDSVQGNLNFDGTKLQFVSVSTAGSAFSTELQNSQSGNTVAFGRADFGAGVSSDALIETVTFKALAGTGTGSLSYSGANADASGTFTNPTASGASVTFTTPPPATCPTGQTGTPPNCTTPPTGGGGSGTGTGTGGTTGTGGSTGGTKTGGGTSGGTTSPGGAANTGTSGTPGTATTGATNTELPVKTAENVQYSKVDLTFTTKVATQMYVRYGVGDDLSTNTPVSPYATSHTIVLDPTLLIPGETYSYVAVSTDANGKVTQTPAAHFKTKGLQVKVQFLDSNRKPLAGKKVMIHSTPQTVKTDAKGFATFTDVTPGEHHVIYTAGKKSYDKPLTVLNSVKNTADVQTADPQNFSVVYSFTQSALRVSSLVWLGLIVLILAVLAFLAKTGRLGLALQFRSRGGNDVPLALQPVVVGGAKPAAVDPMPAPLGPVTVRPGTQIPVQDKLSAIPAPSVPQPGSTVAPRTVDSTPVDKSSPE